MTASDPKTVAARAIPLLDLTDLSDTCTAPRLDALCRDARAGGVAAVCVWPHFVPQAMQVLTGTGIRIATVINFPEGEEDAARAADDAAEACRDGAGEIDLVLPYRALLRGEERVAREVVASVRETCPDTLLKVILETGELRDPETIRAAADLALAEGADFLKTSTGKSPVSATPEAARILLDAVRASGRPAGVKISGGLRTVADAATYLALADRAMGPEWARPATFRLGASSLYGALIDARDA
ncbi:deoxyribose-phosphate aldolase [Methylobacterium aerolatum]|uniref:Deoxyribose-phosphate aldolase n=1 Tax=Methylobacterium aerolatum TaxID=418708 RepID=A0ABU0I4X5_9HYPH|nr:deoxyribose-phosphate aldolase [Methylobacterium aerolatum]MDQ0449671.1 deoxyribose-phosphate aldolase [Methylobacterium aerolatum]GJD36041.1 Deoxyribose-phosphate aldolase [Methylobacterium aerolatum]